VSSSSATKKKLFWRTESLMQEDQLLMVSKIDPILKDREGALLAEEM